MLTKVPNWAWLMDAYMNMLSHPFNPLIVIPPVLHLSPGSGLSLFMERSPAHRITQLCATFICHCWIVVLVTTGDTFHNGLKQSLWKQSFWFAINNPPPGTYVCIVQEINSVSFTGKQKKLTHTSLYKCACIFGASFRGILTMKESVMHLVLKTKADQCGCPDLTLKAQDMKSKIMCYMLKTVQLSRNMQ